MDSEDETRRRSDTAFSSCLAPKCVCQISTSHTGEMLLREQQIPDSPKGARPLGTMGPRQPAPVRQRPTEWLRRGWSKRMGFERTWTWTWVAECLAIRNRLKGEMPRMANAIALAAQHSRSPGSPRVGREHTTTGLSKMPTT